MQWQADILGEDFAALAFQAAGPDGVERTATLIRYAPAAGSGPRPRRAVLFLHGWSEYFFNAELATFWNGHGFAFFALDLHHHGRSLRPGTHGGYVADLIDYDAEISAALGLITALAHEGATPPVTLMGHSTGGLIAALWMNRHPGPGVPGAGGLAKCRARRPGAGGPGAAHRRVCPGPDLRRQRERAGLDRVDAAHRCRPGCGQHRHACAQPGAAASPWNGSTARFTTCSCPRRGSAPTPTHGCRAGSGPTRRTATMGRPRPPRRRSGGRAGRKFPPPPTGFAGPRPARVCRGKRTPHTRTATA